MSGTYSDSLQIVLREAQRRAEVEHSSHVLPRHVLWALASHSSEALAFFEAQRVALTDLLAALALSTDQVQEGSEQANVPTFSRGLQRMLAVAQEHRRLERCDAVGVLHLIHAMAEIGQTYNCPWLQHRHIFGSTVKRYRRQLMRQAQQIEAPKGGEV